MKLSVIDTVPYVGAPLAALTYVLMSLDDYKKHLSVVHCTCKPLWLIHLYIIVMKHLLPCAELNVFDASTACMSQVLGLILVCGAVMHLSYTHILLTRTRNAE
jgi:hypothetical protein